ncbi:Putative Developmental regulator medusa [Rhizopus microsporus]|nr:Putative Developmental regulator medusa [Rhizopus microsporus]
MPVVQCNVNQDIALPNADPHLYSIFPPSGVEGQTLTVIVHTYIPVPVKIAFNQYIVETQRQNTQGKVSLVTKVPSFEEVASSTHTVQIRLVFMDKNNPYSPVCGYVIGSFTYETRNNANHETSDSNPLPNSTMSLANQGMQTLFISQQPNDFLSSSFPSSGRGTTFPGQQQQQFSPFFPLDFTNQRVPNDPHFFIPSNGNNNNINKYTPYSTPTTSSSSIHAITSQQQQHSPISHNPGNHMSLTNTSSDFQNMLPYGNDTSYNSPMPNQTHLNYDFSSFNLQSMFSAQPDRLTSPRSHIRRMPRNFRGYGRTPIDFHSVTLNDYNPYPDNPIGFNFRMNGCVKTMEKDWTPEEFSNHRRLVMFTRATEHTGIVCDFEPVSQNQISKKDAIIVSCIQWPDEGSYWITSVDCINLAEFLVGRPFSVDYKNCIRRNLEGFGPTTVSKTKPESQEFFRLIMAFSNPKPRNIEKDIKVFQWHVLPFALKKIIIKYNTEQP